VDFTNRKAAIEGSHARWANKQQERNKQKRKTNPTKSKNKSHKKQKQIPQTEMPSPLHSIVRSEIQRLFIKILYVLDDNRRSQLV